MKLVEIHAARSLLWPLLVSAMLPTTEGCSGCPTEGCSGCRSGISPVRSHQGLNTCQLNETGSILSRLAEALAVQIWTARNFNRLG